MRRNREFPLVGTFDGSDGPSPGSCLELSGHPRPDGYWSHLAESYGVDTAADPTLFVTAIIPAERHFGGAHTALGISPFPIVILERLDEACNGDPLFVPLFPVQGGRRPGVADAKIYLLLEGTFTKWGCWAGILASTKRGPG